MPCVCECHVCVCLCVCVYQYVWYSHVVCIVLYVLQWWEELLSHPCISCTHPQTSVHIVNPVNGQIRLTWNKSPHALRGADGPRLLADVLLDEVLVNLSEHQYHSFLNLVDELQMRRRAVAVARWRPRTAVKEE